MQLLDELENDYGKHAVVTVRPYVDDSGKTLRWVVHVDGEEVSNIDVATRHRHEGDDVVIKMVLVRGNDELEVARWHEDGENRFSLKAGAPYHAHGPAEVIWTVGGLRRHYAKPQR